MSTVPHTLERVHFSPQTIYCGDCAQILDSFPDNAVDLIYIDQPFMQGRAPVPARRNYEVFWGSAQEKRAVGHNKVVKFLQFPINLQIFPENLWYYCRK